MCAFFAVNEKKPDGEHSSTGKQAGTSGGTRPVYNETNIFGNLYYNIVDGGACGAQKKTGTGDRSEKVVTG